MPSSQPRKLTPSSSRAFALSMRASQRRKWSWPPGSSGGRRMTLAMRSPAADEGAGDVDGNRRRNPAAARLVDRRPGDRVVGGEAVAEDVALAGPPLFEGCDVAVGDVVHVGERQAAGRNRRQAAADHVANDAVEAGVGPWARPVDRGRVDDHDLDALLGLGQHELLGMLLGALVGGALRVVGEPRLIQGAAAVGVEDVEGGGVDGALRARLPRSGDHVEGALRVDLLERRVVAQPLLVDPHAVEDPVDSLRGAVDRLGLGHVAGSELDARREDRAGGRDVADEGHNPVAAVEQTAGDGVSDLAGCSGDEVPHRRSVDNRRRRGPHAQGTRPSLLAAEPLDRVRLAPRAL